MPCGTQQLIPPRLTLLAFIEVDCVLFRFVEKPGLSAIFAGLELIFAGQLQKDKNQSFCEGLQMKNKQGYPVTSVYTDSILRPSIDFKGQCLHFSRQNFQTKQPWASQLASMNRTTENSNSTC